MTNLLFSLINDLQLIIMNGELSISASIGGVPMGKCSPIALI